MSTDNTSQIDREKLESVQRLDALLSLIAKVMLAQDLRAKELLKEETDNGELKCKATNKSNQV